MAEPTLFDEASLALIASGGAGKDGKVYSVKPVPVYGPELVTNGDFATDSDWTKPTGWTIANGKANSNTSAYRTLAQNIPIVLGKKYKVFYDVVSYTSGGVSMTLGADSGALRSAVGSYSEIIEYNTFYSSSGPRSGASGFVGSIDNVSVKEVLSPDGDFTFSRGSNLAATRVGADGLIEKGRENLLKQSNNFGTTWAQSGTLTSGQTGYNGSSDAWRFENPSSTSSLYQPNTSSGVQTMSAYFKKNATYGVRFYAFGSSNANTYFDLNNGFVVAQNNTIDASIEPVGTDWFRCSMTFNQTNTYCEFYVTNNAQVQVLGEFTIQDAQLEIGLAATDVIETGATTGKAGLLEDEPRFDYSGGATCPSLLLEPSRTNEIIFSEYFGSIEWIKRTSDGTAVPVVTDNYAVSPEGVQNAARVVVTKPSTDNDFAVINDNNGIVKSLGDKFTSSVYLKATDASQVGKIVDMYTYESGGGYRAVKSHILTNDWVRLDAIGTFIVSTGNVELINIGKARSSAGGTTLANMATDFLVYGAQFEAGSYPTSYIPNHSGGSVTRGADSCTGAGDATTFNDSEGVLYVEASTLTNGGVSRSVVITDGTDDNLLIIQWNLNLNRMQFFARSGGGAYDVLSINGITQTDVNKIALSWDSVNYYAWINGVKLGTKQFTNVPTGLSELAFGQSAASAFNGNTKQVLVFKEALSDTELIKLTTI